MKSNGGGFLSRLTRGQDDDIDRYSKHRSGRIDIYSENMEFGLTNVQGGASGGFKCDCARWLKEEERKKHWLIEGLVGAKWGNLWIEFTPESSGYVLINLRGSFYEDLNKYHHDVWVDDCEVEGANIQNGSFEMSDPNSKPAYWGWQGSAEKYSTSGAQAHTGNCGVLIWHDIPLLQKFKVEAGKKYKVSAWFKGYGVTASAT
jgi:hypothetical protein